MQSGSDVSPQNLGQFVHVEDPDPGVDDQVYHGGHAEQLSLVNRNLERKVHLR